MSRPATPNGRRVAVTVKLSDDEARALDTARAGEPRSAWARRVLLTAITNPAGEPAPARPGRPARQRKEPAPRSEPAPARCTHSGTRITGGWCTPCGRQVQPGGH